MCIFLQMRFFHEVPVSKTDKSGAASDDEKAKPDLPPPTCGLSGTPGDAGAQLNTV